MSAVVSFSPNKSFNGLRVFSATMVADRDLLGEKVTEWMRANPHITVTQTVVTQSSDDQFHCIAITVFYNEDMEAGRAEVPPRPRRLKFNDAEASAYNGGK